MWREGGMRDGEREVDTDVQAEIPIDEGRDRERLMDREPDKQTYK